MLTSKTQDALYVKLGEVIKEYRNKLDIKQDLLADFVGLSRISIVNIEKGKQKVQVHTLLEIAKYLQIPISQLLEPLNELIADEIDNKLEKRITKEIKEDKQENIQKIKEFINFTLNKKS